MPLINLSQKIFDTIPGFSPFFFLRPKPDTHRRSMTKLGLILIFAMVIFLLRSFWFFPLSLIYTVLWALRHYGSFDLVHISHTTNMIHFFFEAMRTSTYCNCNDRDTCTLLVSTVSNVIYSAHNFYINRNLVRKFNKI